MNSEFSYRNIKKRVVSERVLQDPLSLLGILGGLGAGLAYLLFGIPFLLPVGTGLAAAGLLRMGFLRTFGFSNLLERHLSQAVRRERHMQEKEQASLIRDLKKQLAALGIAKGVEQVDELEESFNVLSKAVDEKFASGGFTHDRYEGAILAAHNRILQNLKQATEYLDAANDIGEARSSGVAQKQANIARKAEQFVDQNTQLIADLQMLRLSLVDVPATRAEVMRDDEDDAISEQLQDLSERSKVFQEALKVPA